MVRLATYNPTRFVVRFAKILTVISSVLSIIFLINYPIYLNVNVDIRNLVFLIAGGLGFVEIFLIVVVVAESRVLLPIALGYSTFILFYSTIGFIFCFCFMVVQVLSKFDEKNEKKELPMMNFIAAFPVVLIFTILYLLRSVGIWLVYRRSRVEEKSSSGKVATSSLITSRC